MNLINTPEAAFALRRAEDRLEVALVAGRMATWEWDPDTDVVTASEAMRRLFGLRPEDPLENSTQGFSLIHPEDREAQRARVQAALGNGGAWQFEYRIVRPRDGQVVWVEERAHTVYNAGTGRYIVLGVVWDITERKRTEEALRESESRYRALFNGIDQGFCVQQVAFGDTGEPLRAQCLEVNHAFERMAGLGDVQWLPVLARVALTGEPMRFDTRSAASDRWFDIRCVRIGEAAERKVASVVTDITQRRQAEERLRRAAEYDAFRVSLNEALRGLDEPDAMEATAARLLEDQLRLDLACLVDLAGAEDEPAGFVLEELRAGRGVVVRNVEADRRLTPDERRRCIERGAQAFVRVPFVKAGALAGFFSAKQSRPREWTADDITRVEETAHALWISVERARSEAALHRAHEELESRVQERTRELALSNELLRAQVSQRQRAEQARNALLRQLVNAQEAERRRISRELHDELGQQVSALVLKLSMMRQDGSLPAATRAEIASLERIARKTDNDLDFLVWQLRPPVLDDLGLVAALQEYAHNWSTHFGVPCDFTSAGGDQVRVDPEIETMLYRFAQEALNNIAKHARAAHVDLRLERGASHASLCVEDDGVGFDVKEVAQAARGLGLVGMRERISFVGGHLSIDSKPGAGSRVKVDVPLPTSP